MLALTPFDWVHVWQEFPDQSLESCLCGAEPVNTTFPSSEVKTVGHPGHATQSREPVQCDNQIHNQTFLNFFALFVYMSWFTCVSTDVQGHVHVCMCRLQNWYLLQLFSTFVRHGVPLTESGVYWFARLNDLEAQIFLCQPHQCWDSVWFWHGY